MNYLIPSEACSQKGLSYTSLLGLIVPPTQWVGFHKEVRNSFRIAKIIPAYNRDSLLKVLELSYKLWLLISNHRDFYSSLCHHSSQTNYSYHSGNGTEASVF